MGGPPQNYSAIFARFHAAGQRESFHREARMKAVPDYNF